MLDCLISFSLWWTVVKIAIHTPKCKQKWLKINNRERRGVGIKMSGGEKKGKKWGGGGGGGGGGGEVIIRDSRVSNSQFCRAKSYLKFSKCYPECLIDVITLEFGKLFNWIQINVIFKSSCINVLQNRCS